MTQCFHNVLTSFENAKKNIRQNENIAQCFCSSYPIQVCMKYYVISAEKKNDGELPRSKLVADRETVRIVTKSLVGCHDFDEQR